MFKSAVFTVLSLAVLSPVGEVSAQQSGQVPADAVIMCEHLDFVGPCKTFKTEAGTRHLLVHWMAPDFGGAKISSVAVGKDVEVWVFEGSNFLGYSAVIRKSMKSLGASTGRGGEDFYPYPWSKERPHTYSTGRGDQDSARSSAKQWTGSLFEDWNDRILSFIVYPRGSEPPGVLMLGTQHTTPPMKGTNTVPVAQFFPMPEQPSELRQNFSAISKFGAQAWLIRIPPPVEAVLFDQARLKGNQIKLPGVTEVAIPGWRFKQSGWQGEWNPHTFKYEFSHWSMLEDYQFKEKVLSLIVRVRGWNMGMEAPERGGGGDSPRHRAPPAQPPGMGQVGEVLPIDDSALPTIEGRQLGPVPAAGQLSLEPGTNRPGNDYRSFNVPQADPELCRSACAEEAQCQAYTYVKPGIQGDSATCWLKKAAAPAVSAPCCVSGARQAGN